MKAIVIAALAAAAAMTACDNPFKTDGNPAPANAPAPMLNTNTVNNVTIVQVRSGRDTFFAVDDGEIVQRINPVQAADLINSGVPVETNDAAAVSE